LEIEKMNKPMKILIAFDGSECANAALDDLVRAGLPDHAEVTVISAADVFISPSAAEADEDASFPFYVPRGVKFARAIAKRAFKYAEDLAQDGAEKISKNFPDWTVTAEARADTPHWAIIAKEREWKPDLIVVGSQGRSALGRLILGSVSQKVLYEAGCTVRIARGRNLDASIPIKLVAGTDGSPGADEMLNVISSRIWPNGTEIKLITTPELGPVYGDEPDLEMERIEAVQKLAEKKLTACGLVVTPIVMEGDPKRVLVNEAGKWGADCIFLGAKGHRFKERLILGSVSSSVAARAHCSVEVIRKTS
jgi:nucleotide-binding universal stress UspA family protein